METAKATPPLCEHNATATATQTATRLPSANAPKITTPQIIQVNRAVAHRKFCPSKICLKSLGAGAPSAGSGGSSGLLRGRSRRIECNRYCRAVIQLIHQETAEKTATATERPHDRQPGGRERHSRHYAAIAQPYGYARSALSLVRRGLAQPPRRTILPALLCCRLIMATLNSPNSRKYVCLFSSYSVT